MDDLNLAVQATISQPSLEAVISQPSMRVVVPQQPSLNVVVVSGPRGPAGADGSGSMNLTGQYPIFYDAGSGIVGIVSGYYVTFPDLIGASGALAAQISSSNAGVGSLNGLSGLVTLAAINPLFISTQGQTLYISGSGLATSGDINGLNASISSLSGYTNTLVEISGAAAWNAAQNNAINLSGAIQNTGSALYSLITGNTGVANLSGYITTGQADARYYPLLSNPSGYLTTGQSGQFYPASNPNQYATSGDLGSTGSYLYSLITGVSGNGASTAALSGYVNQQIALVSGLIEQTGSQTWNAANNNGLNLSGQLYLTGSSLYNLTTGASGYLLGLISASSAGVSSLNGLSGVVNINGAGNVFVTQQGQNIIVSGNTGDYILFALKTDVTQTGIQLLGAINSLSGWTYSASGALQSIIEQTGQAAILYASGASGFLQAQIDALPTAANLQSTGQQLYELITGLSGQSVIDYATKVQLTQTGATLDNKINALSGYVDAQDYATGRAAILYASGISGILGSLIVATGNAAVAHANGIGTNLSGNLTLTGQTLQSRIDSLSGFSISVISGGLEVRIAQTGAAAIAYANGIGSNLSGNLTLTGQTLYVLTTGLSGAFNTQIATTGQQAWSAANNNGINLSGNLTLTGQTLQGRITALSGFTLGVSGALQALITNSDADVNSINGQSGTLFISGTGGLTVLSGAQGLILISGDQSISGALTATGVALGAKIDSLSGFVVNVSGGLETRIAQTGSAAVAHANGIGINLSGALTQSGIALMARDLLVSGWLATGIAQTGSNLYITLTGLSGQANINYATVINLGLTGQTLYQFYTGLSGALIQTGSTLGAQIGALSGFVLGVSGYLQGQIALTGQQVWSAANNNALNLSGNLTTTGQTLYNLIVNASGNYVPTGTLIAYVTGIVTGWDTGWFSFRGHTFTTIPVVTATIELSGNSNLYGVAISGRSTSGFFGLFTAPIDESGVYLNIIVKS